MLWSVCAGSETLSELLLLPLLSPTLPINCWQDPVLLTPMDPLPKEKVGGGGTAQKGTRRAYLHFRYNTSNSPIGSPNSSALLGPDPLHWSCASATAHVRACLLGWPHVPREVPPQQLPRDLQNIIADPGCAGAEFIMKLNAGLLPSTGEPELT